MNAGQERVLYSVGPAANPPVLVTNERIVLGFDKWNIKDLRSAELVTDKLYSSRRMAQDNPRAMIPILFGLLCLLGAINLPNSELARSNSDLAFWLEGGLFILLMASMIFALVRNPVEVYRLRVTLWDGRQQTARYVWYKGDSTNAAQSLLRAINLALGAQQQGRRL